MCSVRGIGVAESASTSTSSRSCRSSSFCATPNRCSSSTITRPRSFGITSRERTRCVPMRTSTLPRGKVAEDPLRVRGRPEARDHLHADGEVAVARAERVPVLLGEDRRRREHQRLLAVDRDGERGADRDLRLAEADVAADEPVHRVRRLEVLLDRLDRALLILRLAVRELRLEPLQPLVLDAELHARGVLPLRVETEQVAGELADTLPRTRLDPVPGLAAELRERGRSRVGADVAGDLADLLVRDVEPVVAAKAEKEVVARDAGDGLRLEAEQVADAVVLVHDVVARPQVCERLERPAHARVVAPRRRACGTPACPGAGRGRARARRSRGARARRRTRPRARGAATRPPRAAAPRRGAAGSGCAVPRRGARNATTTRLPALTSAFSSFSASASPRAASAGFCASNENGWPCGSRPSSVDPFRRKSSRPNSSRQTARTSSGSQTRSGGASSSGTRSFGTSVLGIERVDSAARPPGTRARRRPGAAHAA